MRRTRIRSQSAKRRADQTRRRQMADTLGRTACVLKVPTVCTFYAEHWHELVRAGRGGSRTDPRNIAPSCDRCNGWVSDFEEIARGYGWSVPTWEAEPGDGGLVPASPSPYSLAQQESQT